VVCPRGLFERSRSLRIKKNCQGKGVARSGGANQNWTERKKKKKAPQKRKRRHTKTSRPKKINPELLKKGQKGKEYEEMTRTISPSLMKTAKRRHSLCGGGGGLSVTRKNAAHPAGKREEGAEDYLPTKTAGQSTSIPLWGGTTAGVRGQ